MSAAGKAAEYGTYLAYAGGDFGRAYDDMGGLTLNVANLGSILDMAGSIDARTNATGQSRLEKIAQSLGGAGFLEVTVGSDGLSGRIGTGGIDLGGNLYQLGKRLNDKAALEAYAAANGDKSGKTVMNAYIHGDWTQENTAARLAGGIDQLEFVEEGDFTAKTASSGNGRLIRMKDTGNDFNNAVQLGHEAYRDGVADSGNAAETVSAVIAHTTMAANMESWGADVNLKGLLGLEAAAYKSGNTELLEAIAENGYDSSTDYWKLNVENGAITLDWDGTQNITLPDGTVLEVGNDTGKLSASKIATLLFGNKKNVEEIEALFENSDRKLKWDEEKNNWFDKNGNVVEATGNFSINITNLIANNTEYAKDFNKWLAYGDNGSSGMQGVDFNDIGKLPKGLFGYVNRRRLLADVTAITSSLEGTSLEKVTALKNTAAHFQGNWVGKDFANQYKDLYNAFINHIGGSIAPDAQSMGFSDDTFQNNGVAYSSEIDGVPVHSGGDTRNSVAGTPIHSGFGGRVDANYNPLQFSAASWYDDKKSAITVESGFNYGDRFLSTGVWLQYRHMGSFSEDVNGQVISANEKLGQLSNVWDNGTIAAHLHLDVVTQTSSNDSLWFQNLFQTNSVSNITWSGGSNTYDRTYWNPKNIWENYWKVVK